jgi:cytochrome c
MSHLHPEPPVVHRRDPLRDGRGLTLLATLLILGPVAACQRVTPRSDPPPRSVATAEVRAGAESLLRYGCDQCHTIPGIRGADGLVGPPLTAYARRSYVAGRVPNDPDHLIRFIMDPQSIKPGSAMPVVGLTSQEARDIAAYLYTLR